MRISLTSVVLCMGMAALSQLAHAADQPRDGERQSQREANPGRQQNDAARKSARLQRAPAAGSYEEDLATIRLQADAAEAACATQAKESREACRKQVNADRERAMAAAGRKREQGMQKK